MHIGKTIRALGLLVLLVTWENTWAGERLDFDVVQPRSEERITVYIQGTQARLSSSAKQSSAVIFDSVSRQIHILDHSKQSVTTVDQASLEQLASIAAGMGELAKSQGGVLGDIFKTFGLDNDMGEGLQIEVETLGEQKSFSGQACQMSRIYSKGELSTQICLSPSLRLASAEQQTLDALLDFAQLLLRQGQVILTQFNLPIPLLPEDALDGTPVYIDDINSKTTATLAGFKQMNVVAQQFALPEGYTRRVLSL